MARVHPRSDLALTLAALLAGCIAPAPTPSPTNSPTGLPTALPTLPALPRPSPTVTHGLSWNPCRGGFECANLAVPLDYEDPGGASISLALVRHPATDSARRIGSIVVNPGGPGASGIQAVRENWTRFGPEVLASFDIVGFDPRGIGASSGIHCLPARVELGHPYPIDAAEISEFVDAAQQVAAGCQANAGDLLPFVGTENVVRDLDQIRAGVGDEQLTYVGVSYGTLIGALYADMFPTRLRALVLDGPIDPSLDFRDLNAGTALGSQRQLDQFLADCAENSACAFNSHGKTRGAFGALMEQFGQGPIDGVSSTVAWAAVTSDLGAGDEADLAAMLNDASRGDAGHMLDVALWMFDTGLLDAFDAVTCADFATPRDAAGFAQLAEDISVGAPDFGAIVAYQSFDCAYWPVSSSRVPRDVAADGAPPSLVIAATGDPFTPYEWGQALVDQLSSAVLLTRDGNGHTSLENFCISQLADRYLLTLATPEPGTTCT